MTSAETPEVVGNKEQKIAQARVPKDLALAVSAKLAQNEYSLQALIENAMRGYLLENQPRPAAIGDKIVARLRQFDKDPLLRKCVSAFLLLLFKVEYDSFAEAAQVEQIFIRTTVKPN